MCCDPDCKYRFWKNTGKAESMTTSDTIAGRDLEMLRAAVTGEVFAPGEAAMTGHAGPGTWPPTSGPQSL